MNLADFCAGLSFRPVPDSRSGPQLARAARRLAAIAFPARTYESFYFSLLTHELAELGPAVPPPTVAELTKAIALDFACRTSWRREAVLVLEPAHELEWRAPVLCAGDSDAPQRGTGLAAVFGGYRNFARDAAFAPLTHDPSGGFVRLRQELDALGLDRGAVRCVSYGRGVPVETAAESLRAVAALLGPPELLLLELPADGPDEAQRFARPGLELAPAAHVDLPREPGEGPQRLVVFMGAAT
jgi:hypothetical protein